MDLVWSQYHVSKASKSLRHVVIVSVGCYILIMGLLFALGILPQVVAHPKEMEKRNVSFWTSSPLSTTLGGQQGRPS